MKCKCFFKVSLLVILSFILFPVFSQEKPKVKEANNETKKQVEFTYKIDGRELTPSEYKELKLNSVRKFSEIDSSAKNVDIPK